MRRVRSLADGTLVAFNRWFTSGGGLWETLAVTLGIFAVETIWPALDPSHFLYLLWLSIYATVTQPALAYAGRISSERLERLENQMARHIEAIEKLIENRQP